MLTRPVASVMVGELCCITAPLWWPGMLLPRQSRSAPSMLCRGLFRKPWMPAVGDVMDEARLCRSALAGSCVQYIRLWTAYTQIEIMEVACKARIQSPDRFSQACFAIVCLSVQDALEVMQLAANC